MKKKIVIIIAIVALLMVVWSSFRLVKTHDRAKGYTLPKPLRTTVVEQTKGMSETQIIDYSLALTAQELQFAEKNDIANGKANCVGYAQLCSAICNQALAANGYSNRSKPVVGYVKNCGINICPVIKAIAPNSHWQNFVKDHDFVELKIGDIIYYFDPSIYDILGNKCLTMNEPNY